MSWLRTALVNEPDEIQRLRDTALHLLPPLEFGAAVIHANVGERPQKLELYRNRLPHYNEQPLIVLVLRQGEYVKEER